MGSQNQFQSIYAEQPLHTDSDRTKSITKALRLLFIVNYMQPNAVVDSFFSVHASSHNVNISSRSHFINKVIPNLEQTRGRNVKELSNTSTSRHTQRDAPPEESYSESESCLLPSMFSQYKEFVLVRWCIQ